tara:strand:+ start:82 stop:444 length:363 start_codon:yes stop_codon:yes gene_type:complete
MKENLKCSCGQSIDFHNSYFMDNENIAICKDCYRKQEINKHTPSDLIESEIRGILKESEVSESFTMKKEDVKQMMKDNLGTTDDEFEMSWEDMVNEDINVDSVWEELQNVLNKNLLRNDI